MTAADEWTMPIGRRCPAFRRRRTSPDAWSIDYCVRPEHHDGEHLEYGARRPADGPIGGIAGPMIAARNDLE